jgi:hypothetical protein
LLMESTMVCDSGFRKSLVDISSIVG